MTASSHSTYRQFKSPSRLVVGFLFRSREIQKERLRNREQQLQSTRQQLRASQARERELQKRLGEQAQRLQTLEEELARLRDQPTQLPHDPKLPHHSFGPKNDLDVQSAGPWSTGRWPSFQSRRRI